MNFFKSFIKKRKSEKVFSQIDSGTQALKYLVENLPVDSVHYSDPQDEQLPMMFFARDKDNSYLFHVVLSKREGWWNLRVVYKNQEKNQKLLTCPNMESIREWFKVPENKFVGDLMPYTEGDLKIYGILQSMDKSRDILVQEGESVYVIKRKYSSGYKIWAEFVINRWTRPESHSCFSCYYQVRIRCGKNSRIFRDSAEFVTSNYCKHWLK